MYSAGKIKEHFVFLFAPRSVSRQDFALPSSPRDYSEIAYPKHTERIGPERATSSPDLASTTGAFQLHSAILGVCTLITKYKKVCTPYFAFGPIRYYSMLPHRSTGSATPIAIQQTSSVCIATAARQPQNSQHKTRSCIAMT